MGVGNEPTEKQVKDGMAIALNPEQELALASIRFDREVSKSKSKAKDLSRLQTLITLTLGLSIILIMVKSQPSPMEEAVKRSKAIEKRGFLVVERSYKNSGKENIIRRAEW